MALKAKAPGLPRPAADVVYVCGGCGACCRQLVWAAAGIEEAAGKCPGCGQWREFRDEAVLQEAAA